MVRLRHWPSEEQRQPVYYKPVGNVRKNGPSLILDKTLAEECFSGRDLTDTRATLTAFEEGEEGNRKEQRMGVVLHYYRTNKRGVVYYKPHQESRVSLLVRPTFITECLQMKLGEGVRLMLEIEQRDEAGGADGLLNGAVGDTVAGQ